MTNKERIIRRKDGSIISNDLFDGFDDGQDHGDRFRDPLGSIRLICSIRVREKIQRSDH